MRNAILILLLLASSAFAQLPPYGQAVEGRFRTVNSVGVLDDWTATDYLQNGEKVYVVGDGVFIFASGDTTTADNKDIYDSGVTFPGRFFREPRGLTGQYTSAERTALRYDVGKSYLIHDTDQSKVYLAVGTGPTTVPTFIDLTAVGGGGGNGSIVLSSETAIANQTQDFAGFTQTWNNFDDFTIVPQTGQHIQWTLNENPVNGVQFFRLHVPDSLTSSVEIELPSSVPATPAVAKMLTITSQASGPAQIGFTDIVTGGVVNLGYTATASNGEVTNDSGANATIPAATSADAGLLLPGEKDQIADHQSIFGVAAGSTSFGAFPGDLLVSNSNAFTLFTLLETDVEEKQTLLGVAVGSTDLGTFTGTTIGDNVDIKTALQQIETAHEAGGGGGGSTVEELQWSVVGGTGTVTLSNTPANAEKVRFVMQSGLTYRGTASASGQVTISGVTCTIDANDYGVGDSEEVLVIYEQ